MGSKLRSFAAIGVAAAVVTVVAPRAASAADASGGIPTASEVKVSDKTVGPIAYSCMLLGKPVTLSATYTVPSSLVALAATPVPAGPRLSTLTHGSVPLKATFKLSAGLIKRLQLVDVKTLGGRSIVTTRLGPSALLGSFGLASTRLRPGSDGTQSVSSTTLLDKLDVRDRSTAAATEQLSLPNRLKTTMLIPGFTPVICNVKNPAAVQVTSPKYTVLPASVSARKSGLKVAIHAQDGLKRPGADQATAVLTGTNAKKVHVSRTVRANLVNGAATVDFTKAMTSTGLKRATVTVSYGGASAIVHLQR